MPHFGLEADREGFFGELLHQGRRSLSVERMQSTSGPIALRRGAEDPCSALGPRHGAASGK
jgi:hypothetical protein